MIRFISGLFTACATLLWFLHIGCSPQNSVERPETEDTELPQVTVLSDSVTSDLQSIRIYNDRPSSEGFKVFGFEANEVRIHIESGKIYIAPHVNQEELKGCFTSSQHQEFKAMLESLQLCYFPGAYGEEKHPICTMAVIQPWVTLQYQSQIQSLGGSPNGCRQTIDFCEPEIFKNFMLDFEAHFNASNESC